MKEIKLEYLIEGGDFNRAGQASSDLKKTLNQLNLNPAIIRRIAVSTYEAEVNVVAHAYQGVMNISINQERIKVSVQDKGPGIPDIELAMQEGYTTASEKVRELGFGAGMGLSNMKKNTDHFSIKSEVKVGTTVEMIHYIENKG